MRYIERTDVPRPILAALQDPTYNVDLADHFGSLPRETRRQYGNGRAISVTTLSQSPRQRSLSERHKHKIIVDPVLDGYWRTRGHLIHSMLESHPCGGIVERRLGVEFAGWYVHGQADWYGKVEDTCTPELTGKFCIDDYKEKSAEAMQYPTHDEYIAQLNVLRWIHHIHGQPVDGLRNHYLFRDHKASKWTEGGWYPKEPVFTSLVPVWTLEETEQWVYQRLKAHAAARNVEDDDLPFCSDAERWMGPPKYKIYKIDDKTGEPQAKAKATVNSELAAEDWQVEFIESQKKAHFEREAKRIAKLKSDRGNKTPKPFTEPKLTVVKKDSFPVKCSFCAGREFCNQFAQWEIDNPKQEEENNDA